MKICRIPLASPTEKYKTGIEKQETEELITHHLSSHGQTQLTLDTDLTPDTLVTLSPGHHMGDDVTHHWVSVHIDTQLINIDIQRFGRR